MIRQYTFSGYPSLTFDDSKTVRELIDSAFEKFGFYEPAGMEIVTVFQSSHPETTTGWFTQDTERTCAEEIENHDSLCFAYHLPEVFYFAEGGWGHHMINLGNHPSIPDPIPIKLKFDDFKNTVVINGTYCFDDVVRYLRETDYVPNDCSKLLVHLPSTTIGRVSYSISFSDSFMQVKLNDIEEKLEELNQRYYPGCSFLFEEFEIA